MSGQLSTLSVPSAPLAHRQIRNCEWRIKTFVERDAYARYDWYAGYALGPSDVILEESVRAMNSVMRARSSRKAWAQFIGKPIPELAQIPMSLDLIDSSQVDVDSGNNAIAGLAARMASVPGLTEMAVSKVLHLLRPRFVAIADQYVRDMLGLWRGTPAETMLAIQQSIRKLGHHNVDVLSALSEYAAQLPLVNDQNRRRSSEVIPVRLTKVRILDILLWTEIAILGPNPHQNWRKWYRQDCDAEGTGVPEPTIPSPNTPPRHDITSDLPANVRLFAAMPSDDEYHGWLAANPNGFVIACNRTPTPGSPMKLHRSQCYHISTRSKENYTTGDYGKACSASRTALRQWAEEFIRGDLTVCRVC